MRNLLFALCFFTAFSSISQSPEDSTEESVFDWTYIPYEQDGHWVLYNTDSGVVLENMTFDEWIPSEKFSDFYAFRKGDKYGVVDAFGMEILPFEFDTVVPLEYGVAVKKRKEWLFSNSYFYGDSVDVFELDSISVKGAYTYLYKGNKVGLYGYGMLVAAPVYRAIQPLNFNRLFDKSPNAVLAFDGTEYHFLSASGEDLLGVGTPEFELMRNHFVRFKRNGRWHYYNFRTKKSFDSNGNDVVLYGTDEYKIYSANRTKPVYHLDGKELSGFDDYFRLQSDYFAFNSNGRVGLMNVNGAVYIPAKYDRIELIDTALNYFKFFRGDSCGLVTRSGTELFQPQFANIVSTRDPDRLIVMDRGFTGVVDKSGKVIIPIEYAYIDYGYKCFLLRKGDLIGLADNDGQIIFKPQFSTYFQMQSKRYSDEFYAIIFKDPIGRLTLANNREKLTAKTFSDFNYGNQTLKLYRPGEIEVLVLNDNADIEDRATYTNVGSMVVNSNDYVDQVRFGLTGWSKSYLEENQLNGKFGLRLFTEKGLGVQPVYTEIQFNDMGGYFGERKAAGEFSLVNGVTVKRSAVYDHMYTGNAKVANVNLISAESILHYTSSRWTSTCIVHDAEKHGTIEVPHNHMPFTFGELDSMNLVYGRQYGASLPKKYLIDAKPVLCGMQDAEFSLFEYYHYFSILGGLRMTPETAPLIMNPHIGVRFEGGQRRVSSKNAIWSLNRHLTFDPWETFSDFGFTTNGDYVFSKSLDDTTLWTLEDYEWRKDDGPLDDIECIAIHEYENPYSTLLELQEPGKTEVILHSDFPDFEFISVDSLKTKYQSGRLIVEDSKGVSLRDPHGTVYASGLSAIRYMGEGLFGFKDGNGWRVVNRNGEAVFERTFSVVGMVTDGTFYAQSNGSRGIYTTSGQVIFESPNDLTHVEGSLYRVNTTPEVWYDVDRKLFDTLQADESYLGAMTFMSKTGEDRYTLRRFGVTKPLNITSDRRPLLMHNAIVYRKKNKHYVFEQNGNITFYKKASNPKKAGDFIVIDGKKERYILNENGDFVHSVEEDADVSAYGNKLLISTSDTNYVVLQDGQTEVYGASTTESELASLADSDVKIFRENGSYVAKRAKEIIIPAKYDRLFYLGNGEFRATQSYSINMYDSHLERMNPIPYQHCYFPDELHMVLKLNGQWYFFRKTDSWIPLK